MQPNQNSSRFIYPVKSLLFIIISVTLLSFAVSSQSLDTSFAPVVYYPAGFSGGFTPQPDGKILVYGNFNVVQGVMRNKLARLNADGSLDSSFECAACDFGIGSAVVLPNGKIIVAGAKTSENSGFGPRIRRLNVDGSLDSSFTSPFNESQSGFSPSLGVQAIQPDGKIFVVLYQQGFGIPAQDLYRLNADGSFDNSFTALHFNYGSVRFGPDSVFTSMKLLPDGKLMISGKHPYGYLFRVNPDGSKDTTFQSPTLTVNNGGTTQAYLSKFDIRSDGKIILYGYFTTINGVSRSGFARLNADQSVDASYTFPLTLESVGPYTLVDFQFQPDDKLLVSGTFSGGKRLVRFNTDDTPDTGFSLPTEYRYIGNWKLAGNGKILAALSTLSEYNAKLLRLNSDGSLDPTFDTSFGTPPKITASTVRADGKIIIAGNFSQVGNFSRQRLARLNEDGSPDPTFNAGNAYNSDIYQLVSQPDGKILAVGVFDMYNGIPRNSFARINADGSLDTGFDVPAANSTSRAYIATAALQPDGKILIGGDFTSVHGGNARTGFARLNADGSLDNSFNPVLGGAGVILRILAQPDGKILIGGIFSSVNGTARQNLARLNADGTLDTSFNGGLDSDVRIIERQTDGKYLVSNRYKIYRKNIDGSADSAFTSIDFDNNSSLWSILPQADGTILVGGFFTSVGNDTTKTYLVRLAPNGTLQNNFLPNSPNGKVWSLAKQGSNKIFVAGEFTSIGGSQRLGTARFIAPQVTGKTLFDYDGDGKADVSVFRPSENKWFILNSSDSSVVQPLFGAAGDISAPADYDGDGKTDIGIFRPSTGTFWYAATSQGGAFRAVQWGQNGDIPLPSDFDGDGKADFIVYRPSSSTWYRLSSAGGSSQFNFGASGDKPLIGDFDGDGKADYAIYRPSTGAWWYAASSANNAFRAIQWGISEDIPVAADYDGDGKTDTGVFRPSNGGWYILNSGNGSATIQQFGISADKPVAADYDGDGKADIAVWRPSNGNWYLMRSTSGFSGLQWGASTDIPTQNSFVP